jgi:hypothetical protein
MDEHDKYDLCRPESQRTMNPCFTHFFPLQGSEFHFVCTQNPDDGTASRLVRSHAVAHGLKNKRKLRQKMGLNFNAVSIKGGPGRSTRKREQEQNLVAPPYSLSASAPSQFQMLAAESPMLQALLHRCKSGSAWHYPVKAYME